MDLNAIEGGTETEDWTDEDWHYDAEWDCWYTDSDINAMDWDWYEYDVNALDTYDAETDTWYSSWDDYWTDWHEDDWGMNALHYQTPTVSQQQSVPTQGTQTIMPQQGTMMQLPVTQPPHQLPPQLAITQPAAAPNYAPGTYAGHTAAITMDNPTSAPPGLPLPPQTATTTGPTTRRTGGITFTNPAHLASLFMALIAVLIMPTQTLQVQHEDYLPDCHKYNYIGNLTREMAVDLSLIHI